ncbi:MAG: KAP family NTPase [Bacteroidales bacterium]|nr:KAP family NTPase [Bacteroidales bacterium]MCF8457363.1 KAP family NTPase [Bacteroidales bacterium]
MEQNYEGEISERPEERTPLAQVRFQDVIINLDFDDNPEDYFNLILPIGEDGGIILYQNLLTNFIEDSQLFKALKNSYADLNKQGFRWNTVGTFSDTPTGFLNLCFIQTYEKNDRKIENLRVALLNQDYSKSPLEFWIPVFGFSLHEDMLHKTLSGLIEVIKSSVQQSYVKYGESTFSLVIPKSISNIKTKEIINTFEAEFAKPLEETVNQEEFSQTKKTGPKIASTPPPADQVPTHYDKAEKQDRLNRKPLARSLATLIKRIWDEGKKSKEYGESFMVHVQGQWGSGKSTFLNLFRDELNSTQKWIIIDYNAWQNQHISPPWWTFLSSVYKQARKQLGIGGKFKLWLSENWRRFWIGNTVSQVTSIIILAFTLVMVYKFLPIIFPETSDPIKSDPEKYLITLTTLTGVVLTLISFSKTLSSSLLPGSVKTALSFIALSKDPMLKVKKHFSKLIGSIDQPVAIFIDDLDRCNPKFTVEFLEGIQTLFRETKVLYLVAADRKWLAKCFEIHYKDFTDDFDKRGSRLGYLFIHKAFQLSLRMPMLSADQKEKYWEFILHLKKEDKSLDDKKAEMAKEFEGLTSRMDVEQKAQDLENQKIVPEELIREAAIGKLSEQNIAGQTEHILHKHAVYLEPNPRAIKRLANFYNIFSYTMILEGRYIDESVIVRWLVLSQRWPILAEALEKSPGLINSLILSEDKEIQELVNDNDLQHILNGANGDLPLSEMDINHLIGKHNL